MRRGAICREFARGEASEQDILREAIGEMTTASEPGSGGAAAAAGAAGAAR
jgi:hypothetical protein